MKKLKYMLSLLLIMAFALSLASCYIISAQSMNKLKGTYKLTRYERTPAHERKEGYTPVSYDYVNGDAYKFEDYLIITGESHGYYVHKDASGEAYIKEITLSYEYSADKPSNVEYVVFNDSITVNGDEGGINRLGVNKNTLNYSKSAFDYTRPFTKEPMRTEYLSVKWEKVDKSTDLSYAKSQISGLKYYKYTAFAKRGVYEINTYVNIDTLEHLQPYKYYYIVIDTANGVNTATLYYMYASEDGAETERVKKSVSFSESDDFKRITLDGVSWTEDTGFSSNYYYSEKDGFKTSIRLVSHDISDEYVNELIEAKLPSSAD